MAAVTVADFLAGLEGVRRNGDKWVARCPAHDDRHPSLSVAEGRDGRVLVYCHTGCSLDAIAAARGCNVAELSPPPDPDLERGRRIAATYRYRDEAGSLLYEKVRFAPKSFMLRRPRPSSEGGWSWRLEGVRRVLYRLPEVIAAVAAGETVWLVEGEKDADALAAVRVCATTGPGGAGTWRDEWVEPLRGCRTVVVVADRDDAGRAHARQVAESVRRVVDEVRIVEAASGKDAADHLAAGHGLDDFTEVSLAQSSPDSPAPSGRLVVVPLSQVRRRKVETLRGNFLAPWGEITVVCGQQGIGKGAFVHRLASEVSNWAGVIFLAEEDSAEAVLKPRLEAAGARLDRCHIVRGVRPEEFGGVLLPRDLDALAAVVEDTETRLLVVDPWTNHVDVLDLDKGKVRGALMPLRSLADQYQLCVPLLAHPVKHSGHGDPLDEIAHASAVSQVARAAYWVTRDPDGGSDPRENRYRLVSHIKHNVTRPGPTLRFELVETLLPATAGEPEMDTIRAEWRGQSDLTYDQIRKREHDARPSKQTQTRDWLRSFLAEHGETEKSKVIEAGADAGYASRTIERVAEKLVAARAVVPGPTYWRLRDDESPSSSATGDGSAAVRHGSPVQNLGEPGEPVEESQKTTPPRVGTPGHGSPGSPTSHTGESWRTASAGLVERLVSILNERRANDQLTDEQAAAVWEQAEYLAAAELALLVADLEAGE